MIVKPYIPKCISGVNQIKGVPDRDNTGLSDSVRISKKFRNQLTKPVEILERTNTSIKLEPARTNFRDSANALIIRYELDYSGYAHYTVNADHILNHGIEPPEVKAIMDVLKTNKGMKGDLEYNPKQSTFCIELIIPESMIVKNGGFIYIESIDVAINYDSYRSHEKVHPFSLAGMRELGDPTPDDSIMRYSIKMVDNAGLQKTKYTNINGCIFKIPICNDTHLSDGIYIYTNSEYIDEEEDDKNLAGLKNRMSFREAHENLIIFDSPREAAKLGGLVEREKQGYIKAKEVHEEKIKEYERKIDDLAYKRNVEIEELKAENARLQLETNKFKTQADYQSIKRKDEYERRSSERKDYFEDRAYSRKERLEEASAMTKLQESLIKWAPALVTAIGGLATAFLKYRTALLASAGAGAAAKAILSFI